MRLFAIGLLWLISTAAMAAPGWVRVTADNGAAFGVDLSSARRWCFQGRDQCGAVATVCALDHHQCTVMNRRSILFDCDGHYKDLTHLSIYTPVQIVPSRSVIGRIAEMVCERFKSVRAQPSQGVIDVAISTPPSISFNAAVVGSANLPDGMDLMVSIYPLPPGCTPNCLPRQDNVVVKGGQFIAGPFSGLSEGLYRIEVTSNLPNMETDAVKRVIGDKGQFLAGPLVEAASVFHEMVIDYKAPIRVFGVP